jgi:hypothetical protein
MIIEVLNGLSLLLLLIMWVQTGRAYPALPSRIPMHFGFRGTADRYGSRNGIWLLPVVAAGIVAELSFLPAGPQLLFMATLKLEMVFMFACIGRDQVRVAVGIQQKISILTWVALGAIVLTSVLAPLLLAPR